MKVVITEASSTLAYHVIQLIASGDVIQNQTLDLVLCDTVDKQPNITGVAYEVEDCVYPTVSNAITPEIVVEIADRRNIIINSSTKLTKTFEEEEEAHTTVCLWTDSPIPVYPSHNTCVHTSNDLCESFKTADVALLLPKPIDERVPKDVGIHFTEVKQIDFHVLDGVFHPTGIDQQDTCRFNSRGILQTALSIANQLRQYHQTCLQETTKSTSTVSYHEEAEFGIADYTQFDGDMSPWLGSVTSQKKVVMMLVTCNDNAVSDRCPEKQETMEIDGHLFLSRL